MADADTLRAGILKAVAGAESLDALEEIRVAALGRKGSITEAMKGLGALPADQRKDAGQALNAVKDAVATALEARKAALGRAALDARLAEERIDVTLPARPEADGRLHPISQTIDELVAIFGDMGFEVAEGPDIEDDFHNFTALNIPEAHPARQMHDTFYLPPAADGRADAAAHPYLAGADPHHDDQAGAAPHHRARAHLSLRFRHDPHAHVPPDRGPGDRQDDPHGPPQGLP